MSKSRSSRKKVVVTTNQEGRVERKQPRPRSRRRPSNQPSKLPLLFGKENYILMGIGAAVIAMGLLLMSGGSMPDPDTWDPNIIYSARRTVLAPILIIAGLLIQVFAIFRRSKPEDL